VVHSWEQLGAFTAILALRTLVEQVMTWEAARLQGAAHLEGGTRMLCVNARHPPSAPQALSSADALAGRFCR